VADTPEVWTKPHPAGTHTIAERLAGVDHGRIGDARVLSYAVRVPGSDAEVPIEGAEWADWDQRGRLVFARAGALFAADLDGAALRSSLIADLNGERPRAVPPPAWARAW
jgi:hypothetical protein